MRWYIVDDHAAFRAAARLLLESVAGVVVGESDGADTTDDIVGRIRTSGADAALIDVDLPGTDGFSIVRGLASPGAAVRCVLISSRPRSAYASRFAVTDPTGFVAKSELTPETLADALLA